MIQIIDRFKYSAMSFALLTLLVLIACGGDATAIPNPTDVPLPTQAATRSPEPAATSTPTATATPEPLPPTTSTDYSSITEELPQLIQGVVDATGITGLSVALVDDQELVWAEGFGYANKENGIKSTPETVYGVASVSKLFTATAIMQLAESGKLDIDQPLQTYIPEFSINSRFTGSDPITLRNLMTHHSGLPSDLLNGMAVLGDNEISLTESAFDEFVQQLETSYVATPPNTGFSYSNLGYGLLGHAVAQSAGRDFIKYMDDAILRPLGMTSSSFTITPEIEQLRSKEYRNGEEVTHVWFRDLPAGGLSTNVKDLSRFMMMVFGDGEADGQRILKAETLAEMLRPQNTDVPLDLDTQWGLSWWLLPVSLEYAGNSAWHSGGQGMWNSILYTLPDHKLGVVVLGNSAEAAQTVDQIAAMVLEKALEVKTGLEKTVVEAPEVISVSPGTLLNYAGRYATSMGRMDIRLDEEDLYADLFGQSFKLFPHSEGRFSVEGLDWSDAQLTIRTVDGRTVLKLLGSAVGQGLSERVEPSPVSEAWLSRLGAYQISNGLPGFTDLLTCVQLRYEDDFLLLDAKCAIECDQIVFTLGTLSDDEAVFLGIGTRRGETVRIVKVDGNEFLSFGGYLLRKLEAAAVPDPQQLTDDVFAQFTSYVEEAMGRWNVPGAAVAVVADGEVVYAEGFGVRERGKDDPVTPDTLFGIGSMTKSINAMMLASLVDKGFFEWDTPVVEIWPDFQLAHPDSTLAVTVRDLLSMRSGMRQDDSLWAGKGLSAEDLMIALAEVPVAGPPAEQHYYDNQGVATGAYLGVMAAGGELSSLFESYAQQMQERLFDPIGMANTTLDLDTMNAHSEGARPHSWNESGQSVPSGSFFEGFIPREGISAAGGVASTANDMARYLITQLNRGESPDGVRVVSEESLTETWTPQINISGGPDTFLERVWLPSALYSPLDSQYDYGMGWFVGTYNGVPVLNNPGDQAGWSAHTALLPDSDTGIVVLTNADLLPCGAYLKLAVQHRLIEMRYGMENQIDGYVDLIADTVRDAFGIEC